MSFYYRLPSLQRAILGASVKWLIAAHGRANLFASGSKRQDNDLAVIDSAEAAAFKRAFNDRVASREALPLGIR
jgi:hypothetical protein